MEKHRTHTFIFLVVLCGILSACGGGGGSPGNAPQPGSSAKTLSWDPPTSYTDSTPLNQYSDLDYYEIFIKQDANFIPTDLVSAVISAVDPDTKNIVTTFDLGALAPLLSRNVTYYISMRAVTISGMKSDFSPPVSFSM